MYHALVFLKSLKLTKVIAALRYGAMHQPYMHIHLQNLKKKVFEQ